MIKAGESYEGLHDNSKEGRFQESVLLDFGNCNFNLVFTVDQRGRQTILRTEDNVITASANDYITALGFLKQKAGILLARHSFIEMKGVDSKILDSSKISESNTKDQLSFIRRHIQEATGSRIRRWQQIVRTEESVGANIGGILGGRIKR